MNYTAAHLEQVRSRRDLNLRASNFRKAYILLSLVSNKVSANVLSPLNCVCPRPSISLTNFVFKARPFELFSRVGYNFYVAVFHLS